MKKRIDNLLVERGFYPSREKAKRNIMAGNILVDNQIIYKAGSTVDEDCTITIKGQALKYVSRGGLKLEKAIDTFDIDLNDKVCMDIGASTGGFTDCMLQNGAKKVYSIDVGYGQFDYSLRIDPRVVCLERTNFRYLEKFDEVIEFASIDVSFISLRIIFDNLVNFVDKGSNVVALIKPQFESKRHEVGKHGVVSDINVHKRVINEIIEFVNSLNFSVLGLTFSPIKGPKGNIEYLLYLEYTQDKVIENNDISVDLVVESSHSELE